MTEWIDRSSMAARVVGLALAFLVVSTTTVAHDTAPIQSASEYDYPPFALVTPDGQADGFSVELMRAALRTVGREVQFQVGPWHEIKQALADGRIQALPLVARNAQRQEIFDFSAPYIYTHGALVVRKGDARIRRVEDLRGKTLVVMQSDTAEEYVREHHLSDRVVTTETLEAALRHLAAGKADAMVVEKLAGETLIRSLGLTQLETIYPPLKDFQAFCFAVRKGDRELLAHLNEGLALVIADGTLERLREKWIAPTPGERQARLYHILVGALSTLLLAGLVAYLWQRTLRTQVRARTVELSAAIAQKDEEIRRRQQAEKRLKESQDLLEMAGQMARVGGWKLKPPWQQPEWSDVTYDIHELPRGTPPTVEEAISFYAPESIERIRAVVAACIQEGVPFDEDELQFVTARGLRIWVHAMGQAIRDAQGAITAIQGAFLDITTRKQAQYELKRERDNFLRVLNAITDGIYVVNRHHDIEYINPTLEHEFGTVDGRKCYVYFHDRSEPCPWCKNDEVLKGNTVRWEWYSNKTGKTYDLLDTPIKNPDGSLSKFEIFHDLDFGHFSDKY